MCAVRVSTVHARLCSVVHVQCAHVQVYAHELSIVVCT